MTEQDTPTPIEDASASLDLATTTPAPAPVVTASPAVDAVRVAARQAAAEALAKAEKDRASREAEDAALAEARLAHDASAVVLAEAKQLCLELCSTVQPQYGENGQPTPEYLALDKAMHDPHRDELEAAYARFDETAVALGKLSNGRVGAE